MPESPAESIFAAAAGLTAHARDAFLVAACGANADLRRKVDRLLAAHAAAGGFLDHPAAAAFAPTADATPTENHEPQDGEGSVLAGRYKLIERIGEGGMGTVWMAQQTEPVKRAVAVKLIRAGMDSKAVLNRFEAERQALAMMDHPNIARVFDAGLSGGCPFFVMELVKGVPITKFSDDRKLTPRQRLELFVPVCHAIQHAHQKGIIHRDIKPSNVLVALYDDRPVPKVIDFGVAKAAGQPLTDKTLMTGYGAVVGTPEYMSPEQASFNQLDVDTRSDVYSLGVLLYELLTGSPPFSQNELKQAGLLEMLRVVREQEPPRPSARLSTAAALPSLAAVRGTDPRALTQLLRSELDWVVMKALEKDRSRRYDTPNGFAADVLRYLSGEAVLAVPPSARYRLRKFVKKHKGRVVAGGAVTAALVGGMATTTWQAYRAEAEAARVRAEEQRTKTALDTAERNQAKAERNLVRSFLRPIGYRNEIDKFDEAELLAMADLSGLSEQADGDDDRLKLLCLTEALNDPETAYRTARRAERFIQAVVGSSLTRREQAIKILVARQRDAAADARTRFAACWLTLALGSNELPALMDSREVFREHAEDQTILLWPQMWKCELTPGQMAAVIKISESAIAPSNNPPWHNRRQPPDLSGDERLALALADVAANENQFSMAPPVGIDILSAHCGRLALTLSHASATRVAEAMTDAIVVTKIKHEPFRISVRGLSAIAPRLDEAMKARLAVKLLHYVQTATDREQIKVAIEAIEVLEPGLLPAADRITLGGDLALIRQAAAGSRNDVLRDGKPWYNLVDYVLRLDAAGLESIASTLADDKVWKVWICSHSAVLSFIHKAAPKLSPADVQRLADRLVVLVDETTDTTKAWDYFEALSLLDSTRSKRFAPRMLLHVTAQVNSTSGRDQETGIRHLGVLAPLLDKASLKSAAKLLSSRFAIHFHDQYNLMLDLLVRMKPFLDAESTQIITDELMRTLRQYMAIHQACIVAEITTTFDRSSLALADLEVISKLARSVEEGHASLPDAQQKYMLSVVLRLDVSTAAVAAEAFVHVLRAKRLWPGMRELASDALCAIASKLNNKPLEVLVDPLMATLSNPVSAEQLRLTARVLGALHPRLSAVYAAKVQADATTHSLAAIERATTSYDLDNAIQALAAVNPARHKILDAEVRKRLVRLIFDDWQSATDSSTLDVTATARNLTAVPNWRILAEYLSHPACVEPLRTPLLRRLEELLVRPRATPSVAAAFALSPGGPLAVGLDAAAWEHQRRFRTIWDAAEYIAKHHPDFPLGRPPKPTPRR